MKLLRFIILLMVIWPITVVYAFLLLLVWPIGDRWSYAVAHNWSHLALWLVKIITGLSYRVV